MCLPNVPRSSCMRVHTCVCVYTYIYVWAHTYAQLHVCVLPLYAYKIHVLEAWANTETRRRIHTRSSSYARAHVRYLVIVRCKKQFDLAARHKPSFFSPLFLLFPGSRASVNLPAGFDELLASDPDTRNGAMHPREPNCFASSSFIFSSPVYLLSTAVCC